MSWLVALVVKAAILSAQVAEPASPSKQLAQANIDDQSKQPILKYLRSPSFRDYTVRVYYEAACGLHNPGPFLPFPSITVEPPRKGQTGVIAARHIFRNARNVTVKEDPGNVIRIWIGNVPKAILRTRIELVKLDEETRHYKKATVDAILKTKEIQSAMQALRLETPPYFSSETAINPAPYPAELKHVTLDEALDVIAKAWDGIVVYGACPNPDDSGAKLFDIEAGNRVEMKEQ